RRARGLRAASGDARRVGRGAAGPQPPRRAARRRGLRPRAAPLPRLAHPEAMRRVLDLLGGAGGEAAAVPAVALDAERARAAVRVVAGEVRLQDVERAPVVAGDSHPVALLPEDE